jgi:hypothetical protein
MGFSIFQNWKLFIKIKVKKQEQAERQDFSVLKRPSQKSLPFSHFQREESWRKGDLSAFQMTRLMQRKERSGG